VETLVVLSPTSTSPLLCVAASPSKPTKPTKQNIIDPYENPRNVGSLDKSADDVGTGLVGAPACGDVMKLQIKVRGR